MNMSKKKSNLNYFKAVEDYLEKDFFNKTDRKVAFLIGRIYSYLANQEKSALKTTSLLTKLPLYTRRLDKVQILKIIGKMDDVVKRLISKSRGEVGTNKTLRQKLYDLLKDDLWESTHQELSLAFMMGFSFYVKSEEEEDDENEQMNGES